ncbi:uncharacterized protein LOC109805551 isoform X2 [Cajanus cajan]|uniref:uncharacterized protein LOC109805551 isoform X2 n=1 Tax=Cajanus cajan TaxID=3821 RepID=UPI00098D949F|nr:uncharacterized protein LOC109805551 isoform X2 [Cajanus cajan]
MTSSDVCPTEDALKAFLEYLVDPMLPAKSSIRDNLPLSQQQSVAKQVHSVVLLYNYYHRKQYPQLAFLSFDEFCKLAAILRPTLSVHMKYIQEPEVGVEKQSSLTEEKILNACKICKYLDAAKNVPDIEGWPISKVAVLLIDSKKENCFLLFSSITEGVWSVIENDTDTFIQNSEVVSGASGATFKKKRVIKKPKKIVLNSEEDQILQIGYSAVKEVAGANKTDIMVLESYTVYSQTKAKTASRFYIMKCSQLINQEFIQVPIKYLIESLQGPLVKRSTGSWTVTSVVEYFHVLPYSEKISGWISRETFSNSLQDSKPSEKNMMVGSPEVTKSYMSSEGLSIDLNKSSSDAIEALHQNENSGSCAVTLSASMKETPDVYLDKSLVSPSKNKEECQHIANTLQVSEDQEIENPSVCHYSSRSKNPTEDDNVDSSRMLITEGETKEQSTCDKICAKTSFENNSIEERALIANNPNSDLEKLQIAIASKGKTLSQTALNALIRKRIALAENVGSSRMLITEGETKDQSICDKICAKTSFENDSIEECALITNKPDTDLEKLENLTASKGKTSSQTAKPPFKTDSIEECSLIANYSSTDLEKLQIFVASKGKTLSQTALNALMRKRNALALQQRKIEEEIALCDKKIQRMLTGGEDDLELKIESIIEGCNDTWVRNLGRTCPHLEDQPLPPPRKQRRLTDAVLFKSPCQELDDTFHENNWLLPIYHVSQAYVPLEGGFQANIAVKGPDFQCSCGGDLCPSPHEARESAAAQMLANLRIMAKSDQ